jgi:flagellar biosynthesis/type III secretory pathway chaperone
MTDTQQQALPQTLGQRRVRVSFNPSANSVVDDIKARSAELLDLCEAVQYSAKMNDKFTPEQANEAARLCALAQTHYEDAAMWAVKAATT